MRYVCRVQDLARKLGLWETLSSQVGVRLPPEQAEIVLRQVAELPVQASRATRRLGSYVFKGDRAVAIRLQFAQGKENLKQTFLHELAHACDHLASIDPLRPRLPHGSGWQSWATALGASTEVQGRSRALVRMRQERMKLVAICEGCGAKIHRLRRLDRRRTYIHPECGAVIIPVGAP